MKKEQNIGPATVMQYCSCSTSNRKRTPEVQNMWLWWRGCSCHCKEHCLCLCLVPILIHPNVSTIKRVRRTLAFSCTCIYSLFVAQMDVSINEQIWIPLCCILFLYGCIFLWLLVLWL